MELNDLVKLLVKAEDPRRQAIEQAQAPKPVAVINGTQVELPFSFEMPLAWDTTTTTDTNISITTTNNTNAVVFSSVTG